MTDTIPKGLPMMTPRMTRIVTAMIIFHFKSFHHILFLTWLAPRLKWPAVACKSSAAHVRSQQCRQECLGRYTCFSSKVVQSLSSLHYLVNVFLHDANHFIHLLLHSCGLCGFLRLFAAVACGRIGNIRVVRLSPSDGYRLVSRRSEQCTRCLHCVRKMLNGKKKKPFLPSLFSSVKVAIRNPQAAWHHWTPVRKREQNFSADRPLFLFPFSTWNFKKVSWLEHSRRKTAGSGSLNAGHTGSVDPSFSFIVEVSKNVIVWIKEWKRT